MNSSNDENTKWSFDTCSDVARRDFFPSAVKNIEVQKTIVTRFLNFYLGGKIPKGLIVTDVIFAAISIMPLHNDTEEYIWKDVHYNDEGTLFFLTPEDKLNAEIDVSEDQKPDQISGSSEDVEKIQQDYKKVTDAFFAMTDDSGTSQETNAAISEEDEVVMDTFSNDSTNTSSSPKVPLEPEINSGLREGESASAFHKEQIQEKQQSDKMDANNDGMNKPRIQQSEREGEDMYNELPKFEGTIQWLGKKSETITKNTQIEYGPLQNSVFTKFCNNLLELWDTHSTAKIILKYFFGIVGLTLMRATTKSYMHLVNTFSGAKFRDKAISFLQYLYSTPHKKCIKNSHRTFNRKEKNVRIMFAKIIVNSVFIDNAYFNNHDFSTKSRLPWNIFKIVILTHTADYGFGLVSMLRTLLYKIKYIDIIIEATYCKDTANSWHRLVNFLDKYKSESSNEITHHWARIVNSSYFKDLTCLNNYPLAVILAVFIEKETQDAGIWKSTWVDKDDNRNKYKELGYKMYEKFKVLQSERSKKNIEFLRSIFGHFFYTMNSSNDENTKWSFGTCADVALKDSFPSAVKNIEVQKTIVTKFLNFYLGGKIPKGLRVIDVVFAAISIMPLHDDTEEFIWKDVHYNDEGTLFFLTPEDKLNAEIHVSEDQKPDQISGSSEDLIAEDIEKFTDAFLAMIDVSETSQEKKSVISEDEAVMDTFNNKANETNTSSSPKVPLEPEINNGLRERESASAFHKEQIKEKQQSDKMDANNDEMNKPRVPQSEREGEDMYNELPKFEGTIQWLGKKTITKDTQIEYGPVENAAFTQSCNKLLEVWDTQPKARIILKYFFGIVGLTLMRATTKSDMHLVNTFSGAKFRDKAISFVHRYLSYSTPHKKCVKSSHRTFKRKEENVRIMFAKIIVNSIFIDIAYINNSTLPWNIFKIAILTHTADYGFGLVSMLRTLLSETGNMDIIIEATYYKDTAISWHRLVNFLDKYQSASSNEITHHWARIVDLSYFKDLTCPNNYPLAVILAVFIEKETEDAGIWKSKWVDIDDSTNKYKELGHEMYEKFKELQNENNKKDFDSIMKLFSKKPTNSV